MKTTNKILLTAFLIIIAASLALMVYVRTQVSADMFRGVEGSMRVIEQSRVVDSFQEMDIRGGISVYIYPDTTQFIRVVADDNLHDFIQTELRRGVLSLSMERHASNYDKLEVHVGAPAFVDIKVSSGAKLFANAPLVGKSFSHIVQTGAQSNLHLYVERLYVKVQAGATANLAGEARNVEMVSQAGAFVYAGDLVMQDCDLQARAGSINHLHILGTLTGRARQGAIIQLTGNPDKSGFSMQQNVTIDVRRE